MHEIFLYSCGAAQESEKNIVSEGCSTNVVGWIRWMIIIIVMQNLDKRCHSLFLVLPAPAVHSKVNTNWKVNTNHQKFTPMLVFLQGPKLSLGKLSAPLGSHTLNSCKYILYIKYYVYIIYTYYTYILYNYRAYTVYILYLNRTIWMHYCFLCNVLTLAPQVAQGQKSNACQQQPKM